MLIALIGFCSCINLSSTLCYLVGERSPFIFRIIDNNLWYVLIYNVFHDLIDHFLFLNAFIPSRIICFQLIPEVPVRQQDHIAGEQLAAVFGTQIPHAYIVFCDIHLSIAGGRIESLVKFCRHSRNKIITKPCHGPFVTVPSGSQFFFFIECIIGKIERNEKSYFIRIEIV